MYMAYNEIRELLERYWQGETSLAEEETLRKFFAGHHADLPPDLLEAQPMFRYFGTQQEIELPALPLMAVKTRPWDHWMKYAAVVLVAIGIGYAARQVKMKQDHMEVAAMEKDTYEDPEQAFAVTQKALKLLAKNLNKGTSQVQKLSYFNEATEKIKAN
jgi:hypothetical protein